jgi:uncharacterized oxidoreductase
VEFENMNIAGNTILITGGGSGIGRALAANLHARGNKIIITGRREVALSETAAGEPDIAYRSLDIADAEAVHAFTAQVVMDHPALNVVINNAGIMRAENLVENIDLNTIEATIDTNLLGPIRLTTALLPHLCAQPAATVINVSSGLAFTPLTATATYNSTKAAIHSWSQSLRHQLKDTSVEVLELVPPAVATDLMPGHAEDPNSMPLTEFVDEAVALIERNEMHRGEILVERVKFLRFSEQNDYEQVFKLLNGTS